MGAVTITMIVEQLVTSHHLFLSLSNFTSLLMAFGFPESV